MPIYEFYCPDNHRIYSFYARSLAYAGVTPRCPDGVKFRMERMISNFAITGRAKEKPDLPGGDADDPRMEAMMAEMEREMSGMSEDNPDPKVLARMMRKMSAITGEKMPGEVDEMIRRMEAGEDPEKLESEYGEVMDNFDPMGGGAESEAGAALRAKLQAMRKRPQRDPVLYEMSEFADAEPAPTPASRKRLAKR